MICFKSKKRNDISLYNNILKLVKLALVTIPVLYFSSAVIIPDIYIDAFKTGHPVTHSSANWTDASSEEISHFIQWTDMLIFDYIIFNIDRFVYYVR